MNGVHANVVRRADELIVFSAKGEDLVAVCARMSAHEEEDFARAVCHTFQSQCISRANLMDSRSKLQ